MSYLDIFNQLSAGFLKWKKDVSLDASVDAISGSLWCTMKITWMVFFALGLVYLVCKTLKGMFRAEPEVFPGLMLFTGQGLKYFVHHMRHQMYGTPIQQWRKFGTLSSNRPDPDSFLAVLEALFKWLKSWLPSGEISTAGLPDLELEEKRTSTSSTSSNSSSTSACGKTKKRNKSISKTTQSPAASTQPVSTSTPTPNMSIKHMKRHSLPHLTSPSNEKKFSPESHVQLGHPVIFETEVEADSEEGFVPVRRDRLASGEFVPISSPTERIEFRPIIEVPTESESECEDDHSQIGKSSIETVGIKVEDVGSRFEKYFRSEQPSTTESIIIQSKHRPSLDYTESSEAKLHAGEEMTPPPGFNGRRTKSVAPTSKYVPPAQRQGSISSSSSTSSSPISSSIPLSSNPPPGHTNHNPNTTSCTAYRRPTGTFASKGYMITSESVFAARASPVPENAAPLERRTHDFFQQRKSVTRTTTPLGTSSTSSSSNNSVPPLSPRAKDSNYSPDKPSLFEPSGQRKSLFSIWNPYTEEDLVVPPGAHLKPVGVIGSRPSSTSQPGQDEKEYEPFSLFNMELFRNSDPFSPRKSFE